MQNKKFFTSVSSEIVKWILRAAGLNGCSAHKNFFISGKKERLGFHSQN